MLCLWPKLEQDWLHWRPRLVVNIVNFFHRNSTWTMWVFDSKLINYSWHTVIINRWPFIEVGNSCLDENESWLPTVKWLFSVLADGERFIYRIAAVWREKYRWNVAWFTDRLSFQFVSFEQLSSSFRLYIGLFEHLLSSCSCKKSCQLWYRMGLCVHKFSVQIIFKADPRYLRYYIYFISDLPHICHVSKYF